VIKDLSVALASFVLAGLLARLLERSWLHDAAQSAENRKLQRVPVPRIGGLALVLSASVPLLRSDQTELLIALAIAFLAGLIDDLVQGGLSAGPKLGVQLLAALAIAWITPQPEWWLVPLLIVAFNVVNTWDNSDGALSGIALLGAACIAERLLAMLLAGFLPWNTVLRRDSSAPRAYLGDSGSHLLAAWMVLEPRLLPALVLPALDLAWVCVQRLRARQAPWIGDRRHLAQVLEAQGLSLAPRLALLGLLALPVWILPLKWGCLATLSALLLARSLARAPAAPDNLSPP
jgi:UDP-N-acetylmuramyl pentapeptide phosphotransferase/UDP-N-acetylglucosamine-1-phosphate transferase